MVLPPVDHSDRNKWGPKLLAWIQWLFDQAPSQEEVDDIRQDVTNAEGDIDTLQNDVGQLQTDITNKADQSSLDALDNRVDVSLNTDGTLVPSEVEDAMVSGGLAAPTAGEWSGVQTAVAPLTNPGDVAQQLVVDKDGVPKWADRDVPVQIFGATGTGANDTAPIAETVSLAATLGGNGRRALVSLAPAGIHALSRRVALGQELGGISLRPGVDLDGHGATLNLAGNAWFVVNQLATASDPDDYTSTIQYHPSSGLYATITANVAVGDTTLTVSSTIGLTVGDDVFIRLNNNAEDANETKDWLFAKVLTIGSSTSLTLDRPIPVACTVASQSDWNKTVSKLFALSDGGRVANLNLVNSQAGGANAEVGVGLWYARGWEIDNIQAQHPGAGAVLLAYSENVKVSNIRVMGSDKQNGQASKGRAINMFNCRNVRVENLYAERFEGVPIFIESYSTHITFDGVRLVNNHPTRDNAATPLIIVGQMSRAHFDNITIEGNGGFSLAEPDGGDPDRLTYGNLTLNTTSQILGGLDLRSVNGDLRIGDTLYPQTSVRTVELGFNLLPSMSATIPLPTGLYRSVEIYVSTKTGLSNMYVINDSNQGGDEVLPMLTAGEWSVVTNRGKYGSNYPFNNLPGKNLAIYSDGTVPAEATGRIRINYWPTTTNDGSHKPVLNPRTYTATNVTVDRSFDADTVAVAELADVVGTLLSDLRQRGVIS